MALALIAALAACGDKKKQEVGPPRSVQTVYAKTVDLLPFARRVDASGNVAAWQEVPVASETGGLEVTAVLVDEGSHVREGQQLIQLDDRVLRAQVRQAEAGVKSAQAIQAQNDAALKRSEELKARGFLAQSALEKAMADQRTAAAQVATAQASLGEAQAKLSQASVRAPVSGLITSRTVVKGAVINVGTELFRLVRDGQLEMNAQIPEGDLPYVHAGMSATVTGEQAGTVTGRIRVVTPQVDPQTRLGLARITLPQNSAFKPGNFAHAAIDVSAAPAVSVPQTAIVYRDGKPGVYVIDAQSRVHFSTIDTGARSNGQVEIRSGLQAGQRVVAENGGFLTEGDKVTVAAR
jgi:RND family efflux transporter MFP subunit